MPVDHNPTKTLTIERAWLREINRRWRGFKRSVVADLRKRNVQAKGLIGNAAEPIALDPSQLRAFMVFYRRQIEEILLGTTTAPNWQARYQLEAYQRGLQRVRASLRAQGAELIPGAEEITVAQTFDAARLTATPSLGAGSNYLISRPIHRDAIELITTRSYASLKGWTDKLESETRQLITDAIVEGRGIDETVRNMKKRVDVSRSRARLIARTETVGAYQSSSITAVRDAEEETGETLLMRWITADDGRVRHLHAGWHGTLASPEEMNRRKGVSPYNCRCALVAVVPDAISEEKEEKYRNQRAELLAREAERQLALNAA